jgi:hypothetical protein
MGFVEDNHLTPAGEAFLIGYMTNAAPQLAAKAVEALKAMEADYRGPAPGYWIHVSAP